MQHNTTIGQDAVNIKPLLNAMQEFGKCLDHETEALNNNDFSSYEQLVASKQQSYSNYHNMIANFAKQLQEQKLTDEQKDIVMQQQAGLTEKLERNDSALATIEAVSDTMVRLFREAVEDLERKTDYYDNYGHEKTHKSVKSTSLTLDEEV